MRLAGKASLPAGGPFIFLLPAGGPFILSPLVRKTPMPAGGLIRIYSTSQLMFRCWFCHSCPSVLQLADHLDESGQEVHLESLCQVLAAVCVTNLSTFTVCMSYDRMQLFLEPLRQPAERAECSVQKNTTMVPPPPRVAPLEGHCAELFPPWSVTMPLWVC